MAEKANLHLALAARRRMLAEATAMMMIAGVRGLRNAAAMNLRMAVIVRPRMAATTNLQMVAAPRRQRIAAATNLRITPAGKRFRPAAADRRRVVAMILPAVLAMMTLISSSLAAAVVSVVD